MNKPDISVLIAARKNSKYLAKFLFGLAANTQYPAGIQTLVMLNEDDTWNRELVHYFDLHQDFLPIEFHTENYGLGRAGLHVYFNDLLQHATGDWIIYFCEDHFITMHGWDTYLQRVIAGITQQGDSLNKPFPLDPSEPWIIVPKFDNAGSMNHIVSRGYIDALGGVLGRHGWIDSYINDLSTQAWGRHPLRVLRMDKEIFHDFTHDDPSPMSDAHLQTIIGPEAAKLPKHGSQEYQILIEDDAERLREATK